MERLEVTITLSSNSLEKKIYLINPEIEVMQEIMNDCFLSGISVSLDYKRIK